MLIDDRVNVCGQRRYACIHRERRTTVKLGHNCGFTLVELMVAITVSAMLLLGGRLLMEQISSAEHVIVTDTAEHDTTLARMALLRSLIRNMEVGPDSLITFGGNEHLVRFTSWCIDSTARRERCTVQITIDTALTLVTSLTPVETLQRGSQVGQFRYLADARNGGQWYRSWGVGITAPLAIGVIVGSDTTVLRIGERG